MYLILGVSKKGQRGVPLQPFQNINEVAPLEKLFRFKRGVCCHHGNISVINPTPVDEKLCFRRERLPVDSSAEYSLANSGDNYLNIKLINDLKIAPFWTSVTL